ncbi:MAG: multi-sensor signal transduction histidine kinase [Polyangiaceae bacterium]|jgi:PAS domain S-box-containing protein|nr:multi-sensor signal transduction histidine kinase [Polyangiaceae bacterium]
MDFGRPQENGDGPVLASHLSGIGFALEHSCDLVFVADRGGRLLFANAAARRSWGCEAGADVKKILPDEATLAIGAAVEQVFMERAPVRVEWGTLGPAGPQSWYTCTLSPLLVDDRAVGYLSVSSDVTGLKRSEQRLRRSEQLMVDTQGVAHLGTWEWDVSEPTATWSAELYRIYGLTPESYTPTYEKYLEMVHPDDRPRVIEATNRVFHEHVPYSHDERIFRPDGTLRHLHTWAHPVLDEGGQLIRLVGVCQDITDQKRAEAEVQKLNADLERRVADRTRVIESSLRDLEAFNAMASHDLRAPLSVIDGSCTLITRQFTELPKGVTDNLERIRRSTKHMTMLVNDLLALAKVGQIKLGRSNVDLSAICYEIVEQLQHAEPQRTATVTVQPGLMCVADADLMRVVLGNLLGNAWKYSARVEHAQIQVGAVEGVDNPTFFVRDNGAGFDMKDAHLLFAPFQRLHSPKEFPGTGMGLAGTQRIIERHSGRTWAEGAINQGATFFFELPPPRPAGSMPPAAASVPLAG